MSENSNEKTQMMGSDAVLPKGKFGFITPSRLAMVGVGGAVLASATMWGMSKDGSFANTAPDVAAATEPATPPTDGAVAASADTSAVVPPIAPALADSAAAAPAQSDAVICPNAPLAEGVDNTMSFAEAFGTARQEVGAGGFFEWNGALYNTYYKEEWQAMSGEQREQYVASLDLEVENAEVCHDDVAQNDDNGSIITDPDADNTGENTGEGAGEATPATPTNYQETPTTDPPQKPDVQIVDTDENGTPDALLMDTDHDGNANAVIGDRNEDGTPDAVAIDTDGDNLLDEVQTDADQNGEADEVQQLTEPVQIPMPEDIYDPANDVPAVEVAQQMDFDNNADMGDMMI